MGDLYPLPTAPGVSWPALSSVAAGRDLEGRDLGADFRQRGLLVLQQLEQVDGDHLVVDAQGLAVGVERDELAQVRRGDLLGGVADPAGAAPLVGERLRL